MTEFKQGDPVRWDGEGLFFEARLVRKEGEVWHAVLENPGSFFVRHREEGPGFRLEVEEKYLTKIEVHDWSGLPQADGSIVFEYDQVKSQWDEILDSFVLTFKSFKDRGYPEINLFAETAAALQDYEHHVVVAALTSALVRLGKEEGSDDLGELFKL